MLTETAEHPGVIVRRLLEETGLSVTDAAERLQISRSQLQRLLGKQSGISPEMALRLAGVFGVDARECLDRQTAYELARARRETARDLKRLKPFVGRLRARNREHVVATLRRQEQELRQDGIEELFLFGSVARDEAKPGSDVDLFFRDAPGHKIGLIELGKIAERLADVLGAPVDLAPISSFRPEVLKHASKDAVRVF